MSGQQARPDYGQDAPMVRIVMGAIAAFGIVLVVGSLFLSGSALFRFALAGLGGVLLLYGSCMFVYMTWSSRVGKLKFRDSLLDRIGTIRPWQGNESTLDVGCGRGLMAIGAAHRTPEGRATGIDLWQADLSGNSAQAAMDNAALEGVQGRVRIDTGDAVRLPYDAESFQVVVSRWVVHNIPFPEDRARALDEMWRVLEPGGVLAIADIDQVVVYRDHFASKGVEGIWFDAGGLEAMLMGMFSGGTYRPQTLIVRKPAKA